MPSYKLSALARLDFSYRQAGDNLKTDGLVDPIKAFIRNMNRVVSICLFPAQLLNLSERFWDQWLKAKEQKGCISYNTYNNYEAYLQRRSEIAAAVPPFSTWECHILDDDSRDPKIPLWRENILFLVDVLAEKTGDYLANAVESMLASMATGAWTTFEIFAGDLWENAVNVHPQTLASLYSKNAKPNLGQVKQLPMSFLERHKYDVKDKMGTILKEYHCNFQKLDGIRAAYQLAFPDSCKVSTKDFWDNTDIKSLSTIRNVIVHCGGVVDQDFLDRCGNDPRLAHYDRGHQLALDGELVCGLLSGLVGFVVSLVESVDGWIVSNPT